MNRPRSPLSDLNFIENLSHSWIGFTQPHCRSFEEKGVLKVWGQPDANFGKHSWVTPIKIKSVLFIGTDFRELGSDYLLLSQCNPNQLHKAELLPT